MDSNGRVAQLLGLFSPPNGTSLVTEIRVLDYSASGAQLTQSARIPLTNLPIILRLDQARVEIEGDTMILYGAVPNLPSGEADCFVFYRVPGSGQPGTNDWVYGGDLSLAATAAAMVNAEPCLTNPGVAPLNPPSNEFGTSASLVTVDGSVLAYVGDCLLYTSPSPRDATLSRMPSSA